MADCILVNAVGGAGSQALMYMDNGLVATGSGGTGEYIDTPLDIELQENTWYFYSFNDDSTIREGYLYYTSGTQTHWITGTSSNDYYDLKLTATTAGLSYYRGNYRNIYLKLSSVALNQDASYNS